MKDYLVGIVYGIAISGILIIGVVSIEFLQAQGITHDSAPLAVTRPFTGYQSGGNCVYVSPGKYVTFIAAVPVGPGGC